MDLTPCFLQLIADIGGDSVSGTPCNTSRSSLFNTKLTELVASVTYMRDYLISNKKDYINI